MLHPTYVQRTSRGIYSKNEFIRVSGFVTATELTPDVITDENAYKIRVIMRNYSDANSDILPEGIVLNAHYWLGGKYKTHSEEIESINQEIESIKQEISDISPTEENVEDYMIYPMPIGSINQYARIGWNVYSGSTPQNSIASFTLAFKKGCKSMLTDLQVTADGHFVCWHDTTINAHARNIDGTEILEEVAIATSTLAELDQYDFGIYKGSAYAGTKILRLEEFLYFCKKLNIIPIIETKALLTEEQCVNVSKLIRKYGFADKLIWGEYREWLSTLPIITRELPNVILLLRGGGYESVQEVAVEYAEKGFKTYLGLTTLNQFTDNIATICDNYGIQLVYSEVKSNDDMETLWNSNLMPYMGYIASSYIKVNDFIKSKMIG